MKASKRITFAAISTVGLLVAASGRATPSESDGSGPSDAAYQAGGAKALGAGQDVDAVIRFYENKLREHPTLFAGFAALSAAYFDKARETHGVEWLGKARTAALQSLRIQSNVNALKTLAAICNYSHRFACALEFAERAARAGASDRSLLATRVESYLGQGKLDRVEKLLEPYTSDSNSRVAFDVLAARGRWWDEQGRRDEARRFFVAAAEEAHAHGNVDQEIWAETNAAGMLLDTQQPAGARPHLERAAGLHGSPAVQTVLQVHLAELDELEGRQRAALTSYESIAMRESDPEIQRRAFVLARALGDDARAEALFAAAEEAAERARAAGEVFAIETQARLYADAGVNLDRAVELARENLQYKQDRRSRETFEYVSARRDELSAGR